MDEEMEVEGESGVCDMENLHSDEDVGLGVDVGDAEGKHSRVDVKIALAELLFWDGPLD